MVSLIFTACLRNNGIMAKPSRPHPILHFAWTRNKNITWGGLKEFSEDKSHPVGSSASLKVIE